MASTSVVGVLKKLEGIRQLDSSSVDGVGNDAFCNCSGLTGALFTGNAPAMGSGVFDSTAGNFTVYFLSGRTGFTSPTWKGYPTSRIDESTYPAASWLLAHGLWYDADLHTDPDCDGVDLLTAYALDLDPKIPQRSQLPVPALTGSAVSLSFHAHHPQCLPEIHESACVACIRHPVALRTSFRRGGRSARFLSLRQSPVSNSTRSRSP